MGCDGELRMSQFVANAEADVAVCAAANDRR
jgi:Rieske 2Fe-2S family protein